MDFPTLIYILALAAYSLFTWWKKNKKPGKNAQNPPQGEMKPEVPEWMKEIFGDVADEPVTQAPKPAPQPVTSSADEYMRRSPVGDDRRQLDPTRGEPIVHRHFQGGPALHTEDDRSLENTYMKGLMEEKKRKSMGQKPVLAASKGVSAYEIGSEQEGMIDVETEDWRRAIILAEVLKPYQA